MHPFWNSQGRKHNVATIALNQGSIQILHPIAIFLQSLQIDQDFLYYTAHIPDSTLDSNLRLYLGDSLELKTAHQGRKIARAQKDSKNCRRWDPQRGSLEIIRAHELTGVHQKFTRLTFAQTFFRVNWGLKRVYWGKKGSL